MKFSSLSRKAVLAFIIPNIRADKRISPGAAPHSSPRSFLKSPVNRRRYYPTVAAITTDQKNKLFKLHGYFVTGFADAECSFIVLV
jgi:hypothetical protein